MHIWFYSRDGTIIFLDLNAEILNLNALRVCCLVFFKQKTTFFVLGCVLSYGRIVINPRILDG